MSLDDRVQPSTGARPYAFGAFGVALLLIGSYWGLFRAPRETFMGDVQRIMYIHVPTAWNAMLALTFAFGCALLSLWRGGLNTIAGWLGVSGYPPAILFAAAIMFVIAVLLHYSTVLSQLTDDNVLLAQEVALLRARVDALEGERERKRETDEVATEPRAG